MNAPTCAAGVAPPTAASTGTCRAGSGEHGDETLSHVGSAPHAVTDSRSLTPRLRQTVTLFCRKCREPIPADGIAYRGTSWDLTICPGCFDLETHRPDGRNDWARRKLEQRECEWCGRTCYNTHARNSQCSRFCSINCERRYLRQLSLQPVTCQCGIDFVPARRNQRHCSIACKQAAYRRRSAEART